MKKLFTFARITKMNDMFLDMNNTFAKLAKIESESAAKICAKNARRLHSQHVCEMRQDAKAFESSCEDEVKGNFLIVRLRAEAKTILKTGMRNA